VFPGLQGGPLCHATAAKAVCFAVAATPAFAEYSRAVLDNAKALAEGIQVGGEHVLTGGTDTHLVLLDLRGSELTGKQAEDRLAEIGITANRNTVPFDERPPTVASGVRFGTPAATMRGLDEADAREVGAVVAAAVQPQPELPPLAARIDAILERRPLYPGLARGFPVCDVVA
jgi:glycine hydroxymethyltransferase